MRWDDYLLYKISRACYVIINYANFLNALCIFSCNKISIWKLKTFSILNKEIKNGRPDDLFNFQIIICYNIIFRAFICTKICTLDHKEAIIDNIFRRKFDESSLLYHQSGIFIVAFALWKHHYWILRWELYFRNLWTMILHTISFFMR